MAGEITSGPKVNGQKTEVIAKLFGLTVRRIQQLTQDGVLQTVKIGTAKRYDLLPTVQNYIRYLQDRVSRKAGSADNAENEARKLAAEAELKETKARMAALELQELEGEMHRSEDVEAMTSDLVFIIRGMLTALPGRLAVDVASITDAAEASERIKQEVNGILLELSTYKYDPEAYKRRVRDRQGWKALDDGGDEE